MNDYTNIVAVSSSLKNYIFFAFPSPVVPENQKEKRYCQIYFLGSIDAICQSMNKMFGENYISLDQQNVMTEELISNFIIPEGPMRFEEIDLSMKIEDFRSLSLDHFEQQLMRLGGMDYLSVYNNLRAEKGQKEIYNIQNFLRIMRQDEESEAWDYILKKIVDH